jgi:hypothetical protein
MWQGFPAGRVMGEIGRGQATELVRRGIARWCEEIDKEDVKECGHHPQLKQQSSRRPNRSRLMN